MHEADASDRHQSYFASRLPHDPRRENVWQHLTRYLSRFVPPNADLLELGAGYCYFVNAVAARRRVAVDLVADLDKWAAPGVEAHCEDAAVYLAGAPADSFDFVFASNFLEHFEWPALDALVGGVHRVLRPGGLLGLVQPNFRLAPGRYFDDYTHRTIFTDVSLADWLQGHGFETVRVIPRFLPLTVKSRLGGLAFLMPVYLRLPWRPLAGQMFLLARKPGGTERGREAIR